MTIGGNDDDDDEDDDSDGVDLLCLLFSACVYFVVCLCCLVFILCSLFNYAHSFAQATTGYYVINVGATTSESEASKNAQKLTKEGYASS
jgi:hypothetical protein